MGNPALRTEQTLDRKPDQDRLELNGTFVTAITDQAPALPAGTLNPMELKPLYDRIIIILGKIIATFKDNCYHMSVRARGSVAPGAVLGKTGRLCAVVACLFSLLRDNGNIKGSGIKESDGISVILFDAGALLNLTEARGIWE